MLYISLICFILFLVLFFPLINGKNFFFVEISLILVAVFGLIAEVIVKENSQYIVDKEYIYNDFFVENHKVYKTAEIIVFSQDVSPFWVLASHEKEIVIREKK